MANNDPEIVLCADSTAFLVYVLEDVGDRFGREAEARMLELLGDRQYRDATRRRRRNDLIQALDRECRGGVCSIRQRADLVGRELNVGAVPAIADRADDRRRQLARDILVLTGGRVPGFRTLQLILVGSNAQDPAELGAQDPPMDSAQATTASSADGEVERPAAAETIDPTEP